MGKRILAAVSGGIDSAVAVHELRKLGYDEIIGATLRLLPASPEEETAFEHHSAAVKALCAKLGIEHHFLDRREAFCTHVLLPSWRVLCSGKTPNPCALCNASLKFGALLEFAEEIGAQGVATGHYARMETDASGIASLRRGVDPAKDQTYFLYRLKQSQLQKMVMPLGGYTKTVVREQARSLGLPNAEAPESQDACFTRPGETFAQTFEHYFPERGKTGVFISPEGKRLSRHKGLHCYTVGQRKGLGVALGVPAYVSKIDPESGDVFLVTDESRLLTRTLEAESVNWHSGSEPAFPLTCSVQIRYRSPAVPGTVESLGGRRVKVTFETPQRAVTPGQGAVFYENDRLLGGAVIV